MISRGRLSVEGDLAARATALGNALWCVKRTSDWSPPYKRLRAGDDFDQLLGDVGLALAVVAQRQLLDQVARVAGGVVHRAHLRAGRTRPGFPAAPDRICPFRGSAATELPRISASLGSYSYTAPFRSGGVHALRRASPGSAASAVGTWLITERKREKTSVATSNSPDSIELVDACGDQRPAAVAFAGDVAEVRRDRHNSMILGRHRDGAADHGLSCQRRGSSPSCRPR